MNSWLTVLLLSLLIGIAGCAKDNSSAIAFGDAVRQNMAMQIIEPTPTDLSIGPYDGTRQAIAAARYKADKVEPPKTTQIVIIGATSE